MPDLPSVSVIITAYNRKEYLLRAIKSVIDQSLEKRCYELIVIKNFEDQKIDSIAETENIKIINMEGTIGEYLSTGIKEAKAEIISFLDDDDFFDRDKLQSLIDTFKVKNNLIYYYNNQRVINSNGEFLHINGDELGFNLSSISILKKLVNVELLSKIKICPDNFITYVALDNAGEIFWERNPLTTYTLHESTSNFVSENFDEYKAKAINYSKKIIIDFHFFEEIFKSKKVNNLIRAQITESESFLYSLGENYKPKGLLNFFFNRNRPMKHRLIVIRSYLFIKFFPFLRYRLKIRMKNQHIKNIQFEEN